MAMMMWHIRGCATSAPPAATPAGGPAWASWWSGRAIGTEKMKLEQEQSKRTFPCQMTHVRSQLPFGIQTNSPGQYKSRINEGRTQRVKAHFGVSNDACSESTAVLDDATHVTKRGL
jgi:hypothetical protein